MIFEASCEYQEIQKINKEIKHEGNNWRRIVFINYPETFFYSMLKLLWMPTGGDWGQLRKSLEIMEVKKAIVVGLRHFSIILNLLLASHTLFDILPPV